MITTENIPPLKTLSKISGEKSAIVLTDRARSRVIEMLTHENALGVRIRLRTRGCSGLSYVMEYVSTPDPGDEVIPLGEGRSLFVQGKALLFLVGTEMDYQESPTRSGFVFKNPHEKGRCGCGTSFHI